MAKYRTKIKVQINIYKEIKYFCKTINYTKSKILAGGEDLTKYNNQIVEIIDSKTIRWDTRYTIRFLNGKVVKNIMENELDFDI